MSGSSGDEEEHEAGLGTSYEDNSRLLWRGFEEWKLRKDKAKDFLDVLLDYGEGKEGTRKISGKNINISVLVNIYIP